MNSAAMELGDLAHDEETEAQMRLTRRAFPAQRHHGFEETILHVLGQQWARIPEAEDSLAGRTLERHLDRLCAGGKVGSVGCQLVEHLREEVWCAVERHGIVRHGQREPPLR